MIKKRIKYSLLPILILLGSCSGFVKLQKKGTFEEKYVAAKEYYEEEQYYKAGLLFDDILPFSVGTPEGEAIHFLTAKCHYEEGLLNYSTEQFSSFVKKYPRSEKAEEASFLYAKALYHMSPGHNLDQTNTYLAIDAIQSFINKYPETEFLSECDEKITLLQEKLEYKAYLNARTHLRIEHFRAATIAFSNFKLEFPGSKYTEEITFLQLKAQYLFGKNSIEKYKKNKDTPVRYLKLDRLKEAKTKYLLFVDKYPESSYKKEAEEILDEIESELSTLSIQ